MPHPTDNLPARIERVLRDVRDEASFIQHLLIDTLGWDLPPEAERVVDLGYQWTADELRAADLTQQLVDASAHQVMLPHGEWSVFLLDFAHPDAFLANRGMTGPLRNKPDLPAFRRDHLLFICTHKTRPIPMSRR